MGAWGDGRRVAVVLATQIFGLSRLCVVYWSLPTFFASACVENACGGLGLESQVGAGGRGSGRKALQFVCRVVRGVCRTPCCFCCGPAAGRSISGRTPAPAGCRAHSKNMYPLIKSASFRPLRGRVPFFKNIEKHVFFENT